ncbi:hypothetical protein GCM10010837_42760 [Aminobacter niigataensis]
MHEAGHAVGRLLMAKRMGFPLHLAVHSIEVGAGPSWYNPDGARVLRSQATCYGPAISSELQSALKRAFPVRPTTKAEELPGLLKLAGAATAQRVASARAKLFIIAMGPAAEARVTGRSWFEVVNDNACMADREACRHEGRIAGFDEAQLADEVTHARHQAEKHVEIPDVWRAIDAIAKKLKGTLTGDKVTQLAAPFLTPLLGDALLEGDPDGS